MAQVECTSYECYRAAQISGLVKGYCCVICQAISVEGFFPGRNHALICDIIEEVGRVEVEIGDNIVLGYN